MAEFFRCLTLPSRPSLTTVAQKMFPSTPQVAVFDTSFHQTMPDYAYTYPIAHEHYKKDKVRKYGFHGTRYARDCGGL